MDFSTAEEQVLIAARVVATRKKPPTRETLRRFGENIFRQELVDWTAAFGRLLRQRLITEDGGAYPLTGQGDELARRLKREWLSRDFSDTFLRNETSRAHALFCERVYGANLCQLNMLPMGQLEKLLDVLCLQPDHRVIDLGCGIGKISEYLSDRTGAHVLGVDVAAGAITRAAERTRGKRRRLRFQTGDLDDLRFPAPSFDAVVAIDTLYFVDDLEQTLGSMRDLLAPGGQMGIWFSQVIGPEDPRELLTPEGTKLARVLKRLDLSFRTWDYTGDEGEHWRRSREAAGELEDAFAAEGNGDLCASRLLEAENLLRLVEADRVRRYLYRVTTAPGTQD